MWRRLLPLQALAWTFHLLLLHPEVEEKLLAEVRRVLGPQAVGQHTSSKDVDAGAGGACEGVAAFLLRPSYDQLRELRYTRAVFLETLRLYPSVPEVSTGLRADGRSVACQGLHQACT